MINVNIDFTYGNQNIKIIKSSININIEGFGGKGIVVVRFNVERSW